MPLELRENLILVLLRPEGTQVGPGTESNNMAIACSSSRAETHRGLGDAHKAEVLVVAGVGGDDRARTDLLQKLEHAVEHELRSEPEQKMQSLDSNARILCALPAVKPIQASQTSSTSKLHQHARNSPQKQGS
jgi:hypothetical protein